MPGSFELCARPMMGRWLLLAILTVIMGGSIALVACSTPVSPIEPMTLDGTLYEPTVIYETSGALSDLAVADGRVFWIESDHGDFLKSIKITGDSRPKAWSQIPGSGWNSRLASGPDGPILQTCSETYPGPGVSRFWNVTPDGLHEITFELWRGSAPTCRIGRNSGINAGFAVDKDGHYYFMTTFGLTRAAFGEDPELLASAETMHNMFSPAAEILAVSQDGALYVRGEGYERSYGIATQVYRMVPPYLPSNTTKVLSSPSISAAALDRDGNLLAISFRPASTPGAPDGQNELVKVTPSGTAASGVTHSRIPSVRGIAFGEGDNLFFLFVEMTDCPLPGCHGFLSRVVRYTPSSK